MDACPSGYEALSQSAGVCDIGPRTQVQIAGRDRAAFLHGMCTNDIKRLSPGTGCEAFLTNVQGKIAGHVSVFCGDEDLLLDSVAGCGESIIAGLDRYLVREKVVLTDRSGDFCQVLAAGPDAEDCVRKSLGVVPAAPMFSHAELQFEAQTIFLRRVPLLEPCSLLLACPEAVRANLLQRLEASGAHRSSPAAVEIRRVESGTPVYGQDITDANLPQEVDRNQSAISFTKGCYLGQETVARLDALGHVNWTLKGIVFSGPQVPERGTELQADGKTVARVTSAIWSFRCNSPLALAYLRRGHDRPGQSWTTPFGTATVVSLPLGESQTAT